MAPTNITSLHKEALKATKKRVAGFKTNEISNDEVPSTWGQELQLLGYFNPLLDDGDFFGGVVGGWPRNTGVVVQLVKKL